MRRAARRRRLLRTRVAPTLQVVGVVFVLTSGLIVGQPSAPVDANLQAQAGRASVPTTGPVSNRPTRQVAERSAAVVETAPPVAVEIPRLGVHADLVALGIGEGGRLEVPEEPTLAGWYAGGPRPGEHGAAVVAGHVDSQRGPGVFWRLPDLSRGDEIVVHREDGSTGTFVVDRVGRWPKSQFPTDQVYRHAEGPELRLITCGGAFDERDRRYRDNIVVFASGRG